MSKNKEKSDISKPAEQRTLRGEIEKWKDIKSLEIEAASEGFEFKKFEEKFVDAKYNMEEFIDYIKKRHLKKDKEGSIKNLRARLEEMWNLLKNKNYKSFENKHNEFNDMLEDLYPRTEQELEKNQENKVYVKDEGIEKLVAAVGLIGEEPKLSPEEPTPVVSEAVKPSNAEPAAKVVVIAEKVLAEPESIPAPPEPKKSLWGRFKERGKKIKDAIFNRDVGKVAGKVSYDAITSVLGIKLATDTMRALEGKGDIVEWWKGRKESKGSREAITEAYQSLMQSFKKVKRNEVLVESETIEKRLADFKTKVESAYVSPEVKKELLDRLLSIGEKHQEDTEMAVKARNEEARRTLDAYVQGKISGMQIAKDAMNFALTAAGFTLLRGAAYAGAAIVERVGKAKKEYAKETLGAGEKKAELKFVAKDVIVNAAVETVRALTLQGDKKGSNKKQITIDFIKALGTVARGFGIYGLAFSHSELPGQSIDKLINNVKEHGAVEAVSDNFIHNVKHILHLDITNHPYEVSLTPEPSASHEIPTATEHLSATMPHEVPVFANAPAEIIEQGDHTVAVEVLNNKEGILHGVNRIIHDNPNVFTHNDGKSWTADEIHKWKVDELKEMGFKFKGDKWGYPLAVHEGAKIEVFADEQGQPHFKLASDEHVTFNKNYKWVDTDIEPAVDHPQSANTDVITEPMTAQKQIKVDVNLRERVVVHHAPEVRDNVNKGLTAPEVAERTETAGQFLKEHNSNPKEFVALYDKMVDATVDRFQDSFILRGDSLKFLQSKINALYDNTGITYENIISNNPADSRSLAMMEKILDAEDKFRLDQPDWIKTFSQTMFDKSDKAIRLALLPDRDVLLEPIKTNGGHAARIWDSTEGKDVFIYDKDQVFNTNEDGRLITEDEHGKIKLFNQKQALKMSEERPSE